MVNSRRVIGITGGIGSGKSHVAQLLARQLGVPVYDCDKEAKRLTASSEEIRRGLVRLAGPETYDGQTLNRQHLADYLFADPEHARRANAIIHPAVQNDFLLWAQKQRQPVVALESAILYESGFSGMADYVLFVDAPEELRLRRAMQRDTATETQVRARMKMQQPEASRQRADFVVDNSASDDTRLLAVLKEIIQRITP